MDRIGAEWHGEHGGAALRDMAAGSALGALSLAASFLVGLALIGKMYYVEWVAVALMGFYLLVAWILYLRDDSFMKRREGVPASVHAAAETGDPQAARDKAPGTSPGRRARRLLLSASAFLALASIAMYSLFGIGGTL